MKILFIDRDGTIIEEPNDGRVDSLDKLKLFPLLIPSLIRLQKSKYKFVFVSNQPGLGKPDFPLEKFQEPQNKLEELLQIKGITFEAKYFCPHINNDNCNCKKPKTGLIDKYLQTHVIDKTKSYVIGDRESDMKLANNIGVKGIAVSYHPVGLSIFHSTSWSEITDYILSSS